MSVIGGYYKGGGADITPDVTAHRIPVRGHTTYVSLAQGPAAFPRTPWMHWFSQLGGTVNYVLEAKVYGAPQPAIAPAADGLMTSQGATPFYSWLQVLDGDLDLLLDSIAKKVASLPYKLNIQVCSERDTDHQKGGSIAGQPMTWLQLDRLSIPGIQHIMDRFELAGADNATFTAGIGGWDPDGFVRCYVPGVDAIQYNAYNHGTWRDPAATFGRTYAWLDALPSEARDLPVWIAEYGTQQGTGTNTQSAWLAAVPAALAALPRIQYAAYFNSGWGTISDPAALDALAVAYSQPPFRGE